MKSVEDSILTGPFGVLLWIAVVLAVVIIISILADEVMRHSRRLRSKQYKLHKQYDIIAMSEGLPPEQD